uniref:transposase n=1 Tax=Aureimonas psammosilenae TaxID=2495496 RepID=UPI001F473342|nr:transposase [Aureimonas psammosilenae]
MHGCLLEAALARGDLTDDEWSVLGELLPSERGRKARPPHDNRQFLDGMLFVLRAGCPWRDMHERYGKWNSVYVRFRRWAEQGVWDALLETLVELGLTDTLFAQAEGASVLWLRRVSAYNEAALPNQNPVCRSSTMDTPGSSS